MKKNIVIMIAVAVGILGFTGGYAYGKAKAAPASFANRRGGTAGGFTMGANGRASMGSGGFVNGTVVAKDDKSITIAMQAPTGGSKIIFFDTSTQVMKSAAGSLADIAAGENVSVTGTTNADGSITAKSIQIRPVPAMQNGAIQ